MSESTNPYPFNRIFAHNDLSHLSPDAIINAIKLNASQIEGFPIPVYQSAWLPQGMMIMTKPLCSCRNYRKEGCTNCCESFWDSHLRRERERVEALKQTRSASTSEHHVFAGFNSDTGDIKWSEPVEAKIDSPRTPMEAQLAEIKQLLQDASASLPVIVEKLAQVLSSVAGTFDKRIQALIEAINAAVTANLKSEQISYSPSITFNGDLTAGEVEAVLKNTRDTVMAELSSAFGMGGTSAKDEQVFQSKVCADGCSTTVATKENQTGNSLLETIAEGRGTWKGLLDELEQKLSSARAALRFYKISSAEWLVQIHYVYALERCIETVNIPVEEDGPAPETHAHATVDGSYSGSYTRVSGESSGIWVKKTAAVGVSIPPQQTILESLWGELKALLTLVQEAIEDAFAEDDAVLVGAIVGSGLFYLKGIYSEICNRIAVHVDPDRNKSNQQYDAGPIVGLVADYLKAVKGIPNVPTEPEFQSWIHDIEYLAANLYQEDYIKQGIVAYEAEETQLEIVAEDDDSFSQHPMQESAYNEAVCERLMPAIEALEYHARAFIREREVDAITHGITSLLGSWLSTLKDKVEQFTTCGSHNRDVRSLLKRVSIVYRIRHVIPYSAEAKNLVALGDYLQEFDSVLQNWPSFVGDALGAWLSPDSVLPPRPDVGILKPKTKRDELQTQLDHIQALKTELHATVISLADKVKFWYANAIDDDGGVSLYAEFLKQYHQYCKLWDCLNGNPNDACLKSGSFHGTARHLAWLAAHLVPIESEPDVHALTKRIHAAFDEISKESDIKTVLAALAE